MPTNMEEPVSWNVESVNVSYAQACAKLQLEERPHAQFRNILPGRAPKQLENSLEQIRLDYDRLVKTAARNRGRLKQRLSADQQPTMQVRSLSGNEFVLQEISDEKSPRFLSGEQTERSQTGRLRSLKTFKLSPTESAFQLS